MIQRFVDRFMAAEADIRATLATAHPGSYDDLVKRVITTVTSDGLGVDYDPDPKRIHVIDDGDYQGTRLFIIAAKGYQPSTYWSIFVSYGSCSGCDTFEAIHDYSDKPPTEQQIQDYWTLMLHMVQEMRELGGGE
jgi:hypothetical protein